MVALHEPGAGSGQLGPVHGPVAEVVLYSISMSLKHMHTIYYRLGPFSISFHSPASSHVPALVKSPALLPDI